MKPRHETQPSNAAGSNGLLTEARRPFAPSPETLEKIAEVRNVTWRLFPQSMPPQRLAFFARNLGFVAGNAVRAVPIAAIRARNPCHDNRLPVDEPREITTLADQTLLVVGKTTTVVLDSNCESTRVLPRVSYLPGNRLLPEPRWQNAFAIFDPSSASFFRFRWDPDHPEPTAVLLPTVTLEDSHLRDSTCALMRDGSLGCVQGNDIVSGWPGHRNRVLGQIALGDPVVRVLPAERVDHVRLVRGDVLLEEYWLVPGAPKVAAFPLPKIPFDIASGPSYLAILQVSLSTLGQATELSLVVLEADGRLRWSAPRERIAQNLTERQWIREYFECRNLATHPTRPLLAVSNCDHVDVVDARNGQLLQRIDRAAP